MIDLLRAIKGSQVYGTIVPNSDTDYFGLYKYPVDTYLGLNFDRQVDINADDTKLEIGRYLSLLLKGSPVQIETLFTPEKYFLFKDKSLDILFDNKKEFLTKKLKAPYVGFIHSQLSKSRNISGRLDWEQQEIFRKEVLDFCFVFIEGEKTMPFLEWQKSDLNYIQDAILDFKENSVSIVKPNTQPKQENIGLASVNNFPGVYSMYYLPDSNYGIVGEDSNDIRLQSIPKNSEYLGQLYFNKNGYSSHCKQYKDYQSWLLKRNPQRYQAIKETGSIVDLKFFYHTIRLLNTAIEIFRDGELIVDRRGRDADYLIKIREGKVSLEELNEKAEQGLKLIDELYLTSTLKEEPNYDFVDNLCKTLRK